jgi:hypothetical protein
MGEIISFYSYKGGVGRTMALANVAVLLAQRGHRVLAVDFDLEAPGLHRYFLRKDTALGDQRRLPPGNQNGVIDMFREMRTRVQEEAAPLLAGGDARDPLPAVPGIVRRLLDAGNYGYTIRVLDPSTDTPKPLQLLTAGRFDEDYAGRVHGFPWEEMYETHREVFEELVAGWRQRFDYVLVDSRTGLSDIGSVSTVILANKLVLAFAPNEQSLNGAVDVGRQAVLLKREGGGELQLFPLVSRVDEGEEGQRRSFMQDAARRFAALFEQLYGRSDVDFDAYFDAVQIPHRGYYAYGEKTAAEDEKPTKSGSLTAGYARFLDVLRGDRLTAREDRLGDPRLVARGRPVALVASFETEFDPPSGLGFDRIIRTPEHLSADTSARLRALPVETSAWEQALTEIDHGVGRAAATTGGDLHVFATMPYPVAVYLGRRLDDRARTRPLHVHQLDPVSRGWVPFSSPALAGEQGAKPFFQDLEPLPCTSVGEAVILAVEGMRPIGDQALLDAAARVQAAAVYRLRPRSAAPLREPAEVQGAVAAVRSALLHVQAERTAGPSAVHVVATAPVALLIELGRLVVPTVYKSVIVHQFDAQTARYVPVLDVIARRVM